MISYGFVFRTCSLITHLKLSRLEKELELHAINVQALQLFVAFAMKKVTVEAQVDSVDSILEVAQLLNQLMTLHLSIKSKAIY